MNTQERILCAAIWYKEWPIKMDDSDPGYLRPKNCDTGIVFFGHRHYNCMGTAAAISGVYHPYLGKSIQGFLTSHNRFVDRSEGAAIQINCGGNLEYTSELFSE